MGPDREIRRYALYGEGNHAILPEFVHIETIADRSSQHGWAIAPHSHPGIFQLLVLEAGQGELIGDAAAVTLAPFSVVVVPSGCVHAFRFSTDARGWVLSVADALLNDPRLASLVPAEATKGGTARQWQSPGDGAIARRLTWLMNDMAAEMSGSTDRALAAPTVAQLALVLVCATAGAPDGTPARRSGPDALVIRFKHLVNSRYREHWSVERYATDLATSAPTLTRACRTVLGRSPAEVVQDRVLLEAMRLLTYTAASISQIALTLGFADPAYFTRVFRTRTGATPSRFRDERRWLAG